MESKSLILGGISLLLIAASVALGYITFTSRPIFNESLIFTGIMLFGATICAVLGSFSAIKQLYFGAENKILTIFSGGMNLILTLLLFAFWAILIYLMIFLDAKKFRL